MRGHEFEREKGQNEENGLKGGTGRGNYGIIVESQKLNVYNLKTPYLKVTKKRIRS